MKYKIISKFKKRYNIRKFRRFDENNNINRKKIKRQLINLRENLKNIVFMNIYNINKNINKINLFEKINFDNIFVTKRIIEKKIQKIKIINNFCYNVNEFHKFSL